jgi:hypothetical protein
MKLSLINTNQEGSLLISFNSNNPIVKSIVLCNSLRDRQTSSDIVPATVSIFIKDNLSGSHYICHEMVLYSGDPVEVLPDNLNLPILSENQSLYLNLSLPSGASPVGSGNLNTIVYYD